MLERNILSHIKLAVTLSLLSSSLLLHARLVPTTVPSDPSSIPLGVVQFAAALACIAIGVWEYYRGFQDMRIGRAFLTAPKFVYFCMTYVLWTDNLFIRLHFIVMGIVTGVIFGTCIVLLIQTSYVYFSTSHSFNKAETVLKR